MNVDFKQKLTDTKGIKIFIEEAGQEVARATLFILKNDYRKRHYGFLEDVFVNESLRGQGIGTKLIKEIIKVAKDNNCYKIVATSRYGREKVHELYERLGFKNFGIEFKMYLEDLNN